MDEIKGKETKEKFVPNLNLDNFLLPCAVPDDCPFVLTSPRSLQACEKLGIQVGRTENDVYCPHPMLFSQ